MTVNHTNHDAENPRDAQRPDSYLQSLGERVEHGLMAGLVGPERLEFFEAMRLLQAGDLDGAVGGFRRASRTSEQPFEALAMVALGECERALGREAAALRDWMRVASTESASATLRSVAWMSIAALAERRDDPRLGARAAAGLQELSQLASADEQLLSPD